jgi:hypothetical protein
MTQKLALAFAFPALVTLGAGSLVWSPGGGEACRRAGGAEPQVLAVQEQVDGLGEFDEFHRLVYFAVLEGLYTDGVPDDVVEALMIEEEGTPALFVYACPICNPALDAFITYRARPVWTHYKGLHDTFGRGFPEPSRARALDASKSVRLELLNGMIQGWIARRLESMRLTPDELARWKEGFEVRRKKGMSYLARYQGEGPTRYAGMKGCAVCDAANGACGL